MEWINVRERPHTALDRKLAEDVYSDEGILLMRENTVVTNKHVSRLIKLGITKLPLDGYASILEQLDEKFGTKYPVFAQMYKAQFESLRPVFHPADKKVLHLEEPLKIFEGLTKEALRGINLLEVLQQLQGHSEYTIRHSIHVGLLSSLIAQLQDYPWESVVEMGKSGLFHDIGKLKISRDIIQKPQALTSNEYEEIKKHPAAGHELLRAGNTASPEMLSGALEHHERMDGGGYPSGLKGSEISDAGKITALADVFDAVSSDRSYQRKRSPLTALKVITEDIFAGKLSSEIGMPFVAHMISVYTGSNAYLDDGRIGKIIQISLEDIESPIMYVEGQMITGEERRKIQIIDIADSRVNSLKYPL